jgi:hypothetical protein
MESQDTALERRANEAAAGDRGGAAEFSKIARPIAWAGAVLLAILSLVPGEFRPHTFLPGRAEHFVAYAVTGFFFVLGYREARQRALAWLGLALASGLIEILQAFIPGRSPSSLDALASTAGLTFGLAIGLAVEALFGRARRQ